MNNRAADTAKRKFNVISYRIKQSVEKKIIACSNKRNVIVERIIKTVELHQNAQKQVSKTKYDKPINSFFNNKRFHYFIYYFQGFFNC